MTRVVIWPEAEADLAAIALYVSRDSVERAEVLVRKLRVRCDVLKSHPLAGPARPALGEGIRTLSEPPYVVVYRQSANTVEVVAFIHSARDIPRALATRIAQGT